MCGSSPAGRRAAAGPGATFKGRVIPGWSLPSPRSPAAAHLPLPARSLSAPEGGERSGRQVFPLVLFECVGPPHHSSNSTHSPSSTQTPQPAGFRRINSCQSLPLLPPLLSRQTQEFISSEGLFFFSPLRFRSVLLPPGCRCATRTDIDTSVCAVHQQPPTHSNIGHFCFFWCPPTENASGLFTSATIKLENGEILPHLKTLPCLDDTTAGRDLNEDRLSGGNVDFLSFSNFIQFEEVFSPAVGLKMGIYRHLAFLSPIKVVKKHV